MVLQSGELDAFGHVRLGGIGDWLAKEIEKRTGKEARAVVLGHVQRGGTPTAFDRWLATRFGLHAIDAVADGDFGKMVALRGTDIVRVPLAEGTRELKLVSPGGVRRGRGLLRLRPVDASYSVGGRRLGWHPWSSHPLAQTSPPGSSPRWPVRTRGCATTRPPPSPRCARRPRGCWSCRRPAGASRRSTGRPPRSGAPRAPGRRSSSRRCSR